MMERSWPPCSRGHAMVSQPFSASFLDMRRLNARLRSLDPSSSSIPSQSGGSSCFRKD